MENKVKGMSAVLEFWFSELESKQWWVKDPELDALIQNRFLPLYEKAIRCELFEWRRTAAGRLAEIIVLDQFSRNMFRDNKAAFAYDFLAVALTQAAIDVGADVELLDQPQKLSFLYMPLMHSESPVIHKQAVAMFAKPGLEFNLEFEHKHKVIIDKFGRYPHRNKILGRESTAAELEFLKGPGSSF